MFPPQMAQTLRGARNPHGTGHPSCVNPALFHLPLEPSGRGVPVPLPPCRDPPLTQDGDTRRHDSASFCPQMHAKACCHLLAPRNIHTCFKCIFDTGTNLLLYSHFWLHIRVSWWQISAFRCHWPQEGQQLWDMRPRPLCGEGPLLTPAWPLSSECCPGSGLWALSLEWAHTEAPGGQETVMVRVCVGSGSWLPVHIPVHKFNLVWRMNWLPEVSNMLLCGVN